MLSLLSVLQLTYFFVIFVTLLAVILKALHQASLSPCLLLVDAKNPWFSSVNLFLSHISQGLVSGLAPIG